MKPDERNLLLRDFFAGYFNQDWTLGGAASWRDVILTFMDENEPEQVRAVHAALRSWLDEASELGATSLPAEFGCDFDPLLEGLNERQWVQEIVAAMEEP